jgi:L-methionine (R)-S-oxide reductase
VYKTVEGAASPVLLKLAYRGLPSRAEFPLTEEFKAFSNNSTVALEGRGRVIGDVLDHVRDGGAYYICDGEVRSEACLPLRAADGSVIGIIDAESTIPHFFAGAMHAYTIGFALAAETILREYI